MFETGLAHRAQVRLKETCCLQRPDMTVDEVHLARRSQHRASTTATAMTPAQQLMACADCAMYQAQEGGRNRYCIAPPAG